VGKSKIEFKIPTDQTKKGIWKYESFLSPVGDRYKLSLNEGGTSEVRPEEDLILKREDENPTGSLKDRGMAYLVSKLSSQGKMSFVLSSSGNAAISAVNYCQLVGMNLVIFVSPKIDKAKLGFLKSKKASLIFSKKPVSDSIRFSHKEGFTNLSPSRNLFGPEGYQTIAFELLLNQNLIDDIFIPVSSGVALIGVALGFSKFGFMPRIHVCQTTAVCPIASLYDKNFTRETNSLAGALVAKYIPLKSRVIEAVNKSGGSGWVISNREIENSQKYLVKKGITTSNEGAVALAGWMKAKRSGWQLGKSVCLLTGKKY